MKTNFLSTAFKAGLLLVLSCGLMHTPIKAMQPATTLTAKADDILDAAGLKEVAGLATYTDFVTGTTLTTGEDKGAAVLASITESDDKKAAFWRTFIFKALIKVAEEYLNPTTMANTAAPDELTMLNTVWTKIAEKMPTTSNTLTTNGNNTQAATYITIDRANGSTLYLAQEANAILKDTVATIALTLRAIHNITHQIISGFKDANLKHHIAFIVTKLNLVDIGGTKKTIKTFLNEEIANIKAFIESSVNLDLLNAAQRMHACSLADTTALTDKIKTTRTELKNQMDTAIGAEAVQEGVFARINMEAL